MRRPNSARLLAERAHLDTWLSSREWNLYPFQQRAIDAYLNGESGLISVPTGAGKTFAAVLGPILEMTSSDAGEGLRLLYLTPLKAVARDIEKAISDLLLGLGSSMRVESRTGDTTASQKSKQRVQLPQILITTPESLSLLLAHDESTARFAALNAVVVDEWHELIGNKRGSLLELALARLRSQRPDLKTWALSATLGNLEQAAQVATGLAKPVLITEALRRPLEASSLIPEKVEALSWAGHLGLRMINDVVSQIDIERSTLIFTNTRSFCERWHQALLEARPDWAHLIALHHGSVSRELRTEVEDRVKSGELKIVVTTSSLDLGVDFPAVDRVIQVGSPKGVARLLQRAGRSAHRPGAAAKILLVPTHALELAEFAALRTAALAGKIESRLPLEAPRDVLLQYMVTRALGGGFTADELFAEVKSAYSYRNLSRGEFDECLDFVRTGGSTLQSYPQYRKIAEVHDRFVVPDTHIARLHRMNIGTIASDSSVQLKFLRGKDLGFVEESFVSKLKRGDVFYFGGRALSFIMMKDMDAFVRLAPGGTEAVTPRWGGGRLPYSPELAAALRAELDAVAGGELPSVESEALSPLWNLQRQTSHIPKSTEVLVETLKTREGHHLYMFPFEGSQVHEGLAALLALRLARLHKTTFSIAVNDMGLELLTADSFDYSDLLKDRAIFSILNLDSDINETLNLVETARRQFREVARVAGLTFQQHGRGFKNTRQVQASAGLLFDVLKNHEPHNLLIRQAEAEVREVQFQESRLRAALERLGASAVVVRATRRPSPLAFPLLAERMGSQLSNESLADRLNKMKARWMSDAAKENNDSATGPSK